jgi:hypothetical protein
LKGPLDSPRSPDDQRRGLELITKRTIASGSSEIPSAAAAIFQPG